MPTPLGSQSNHPTLLETLRYAKVLHYTKASVEAAFKKSKSNILSQYWRHLRSG